jgi:hypothetical protein
MSVGVPQVPGRPPPVTATLPDGKVQAALLAWGQITATGRWAAGIAYLHSTWHSRVLVTVWVPANLITPWPPVRSGGGYRIVPRVLLSGPPTSWPHLPPVYPGASAEWAKTHQHHRDYRRAPTK